MLRQLQNALARGIGAVQLSGAPSPKMFCDQAQGIDQLGVLAVGNALKSRSRGMLAQLYASIALRRTEDNIIRAIGNA